METRLRILFDDTAQQAPPVTARNLIRAGVFHSTPANYIPPMVTLEIISDPICPWCYIGKARLDRAIAETGRDPFEVSWRIFQLNPDMPPEGRDRKAHLIAKFGGEDGLKRVYDAVIEAGKSEGIDFAFDKVERTPNTINSHRLLRLADEKGTQDAASEALFKAYFLDGKDIGVIDVLVEIAATAGMKGDEVRAYLESDAGDKEVREEDRKARQMGVSGVPFFIINNKYAISGAEDPSVFLRAFETIAKGEDEDAKEPAPAK